MLPLTENKLKIICSLREKGNSYFEISKKLSIAKSTAYKYSKDILLSRKAIARINKNINKNSIRFVKNYAVEKKLNKNIFWSLETARVIAHCIFDGSVTSDAIKYTNSSYELIQQFIQDIKKISDMKPTNIYTTKGKYFNKFQVAFCSKRLCNELFNYSKSFNSTSNLTIIPKLVFNSEDKIIIEFLRAFWEDEGCITYKGELLARLKNKGLIKQLSSLHNLLGIEHSLYSCSDGAWGIRILRNGKNLKRFNLIRFRYALVSRGQNVGILKKNLFEKIYGPVI